MRTSAIFRLAYVLVTSQLRSGQTTGQRLSVWRRPLIIVVADVVLFIAGVLTGEAVYLFFPVLSDAQISLYTIVGQLLLGLPLLSLSALTLSGILLEVGQSSQFAASDTVNWLPVSPSEYVVASTFSIVYVYSFIPALLVGLTLPLALGVGWLNAWVPIMLLTLVATFEGGFIVEILRAIVNRISSTFYRRSGRSALAARAIVLVIVLSAVQLAFNPNFLFVVLQSYAGSLANVWMIPFVWPSLAALHWLNGAFWLGVLYSALTLVLFGATLLLANAFRARYWNPMPVAIRLPSGQYAPKEGLLAKIGFRPQAAAVLRKDIRSLTRRKEMVRFIAIPVIIAVPSVFSSLYVGDIPSRSGALLIPMGMSIAIFGLLLGMTSFGQEGKAALNLYSLPVDAPDLVKSKLATVVLFSFPISLGMAAVAFLLVQGLSEQILVNVSALSILVVVESFVGVLMGTVFPDFTEGPQARFVTLSGVFISFGFGGLLGFAAVSPLIAGYVLSSVFYLGVPVWVSISAMLVVAAAISYSCYGLSVRRVSKLLEELRL